MIFYHCTIGVPCVLKAKALLLKLPIITASITGLTVSSKLNRPGIVGDLIFWENTTMKRQTYTPEIKERAVRMLIEAYSDYPSTWSAIQAIAPKIGCTPETLRSWHKKHIDQTIPANEIIRKAAAFFAQAELDR